MLAELVEGTVSLEASGASNPEIKEIPGAKYSAATRSWTIPLTWAACVQMRTILGSRLEIGPKLLEWAKQERDGRIQRSQDARLDEDYNPTQPTGRAPDEGGEPTLKDPTTQWWWDIWRGMPEFLNRDLSSWRVVKVHVRNRDDLDKLGELMEQAINPGTRAIWYPKAELRDESEWRWVDEAEAASKLPPTARKPTDYEGRQHKRPGPRPRVAKEPKPIKPKRVPVRDMVGGGSGIQGV